MALSWADRAEQMVLSLAELLGLEAAAPLALWPAGVLLLSVGLGLVLSLLLLGLHRPGAARGKREKAEDSGLELGKAGKTEEPKKRSRKRAGDKKLQRNGLAVEPQDEMKPAEVQSPDPAELRADKAKKNKKKPKAPAKEAKSAPSERKEPDEAGTWETKVSNREKRQQRRKDKGAGDESGSPGGVAPSTPDQPIATPEEPKISIPSSPKIKNTSTTPTTRPASTPKDTTRPASTPKDTTRPASTPKDTTRPASTPKDTTRPASTPKDTTRPASTPKDTTRPASTPKDTTRASGNSTAASTAQRKGVLISRFSTEEPPAAEVQAVAPQVSPGWEDVLSMNGSGWAELAVSGTVHPESWNSLSAERQDLHAAWPHDMEGSWTLVDGSFAGLSAAAGESQPPPDLSCGCLPQVDDEWSAQNSGCVDPSSDWSAPSEEWGNYEDRPAEGAVSTQPLIAELQDSDTERDKEEPAAPGSSKAKKKKKKKKKLEEGGNAAQVEGDVGVAKDQNTAGNILPKSVKEQESVAPSAHLRAPLKPTEVEVTARSSGTPTQKKPEDSWESPKQLNLCLLHVWSVTTDDNVSLENRKPPQELRNGQLFTSSVSEQYLYGFL
ncbi:hypothetical protein NFI96_014817 [Prochilodus magdalenae]|nr:hypothetical protein NFI96_014817 [Prochilodus magdalenae]